MPFTPRRERMPARARAAASAARAATGSAIDAALAQIAAAFDEAAALNDFKLSVERSVRLGPQHAAVRARFRGRAELLRGSNLDAALAASERWWRTERKAFAIASALGTGNRLSLEILRELRLILRLLRFKKMQAEFGAVVVALCNEAVAEAAE